MCSSKIKALLIMLLLLSASSFAAITKEQAKQLVLNQILAGKIGSVDVSVANTAVSSRDGVLVLGGQYLTCPYSSNWLFFVDDLPFANWHHPCRYIFVDSETGAYQIVSQTIYPENFQYDFEPIAEVPRPEPVILPPNPNIVKKQATPNEHLYAVIISGLHGQRFWNDVSATYNTLIDVYGYQKSNISVLYAYGPNNSNYIDDLDGPLSPSVDIDGRASKATIKAAFDNLTNTLEPCDQLFVFIDDHGYVNEQGHSYINLPWNEILCDYELAEYVDSIKCSQMVFVMEQCYSGGFINDLTDYQNYNVKCKNRVVHTACNDNESSYYENHITGGKYDEFVYYWTTAARGFYPATNQPWLQSQYAVGGFPFANFPTLVNHPLDYSPDDPAHGGNGDGLVQMAEAFNYADNWDTWSPAGYFCPYQNYDEFPQSATTVGLPADLLTLGGISGKVTHSQTISGNLMIANPGIEVESGVKLTIGNNSNLFMSQGSKIDLKGTAELFATNATFTANLPDDYGYNWQGISAASGSKVTISGGSISDADFAVSGMGSSCLINGLQVNNCNNGLAFGFYGYSPSRVISNCNLTGTNGVGTSGISIGYGSNCTLSGNTISGFDKGLNLNYSTPVVTNSTIENNLTCGVYVYGSGSEPNLASKAGCMNPRYNNTILNNGSSSATAQIQLVNNAKILLDIGYNNIYSTNNSIKCISQGTKPAYNIINKLAARQNYWGGSGVNNNYFYPTDGWVNYTSFKPTPYSNNDGKSSASDPAMLLIEGLNFEESQQFAKADAKYNELITAYPATPESYFAISRQPGVYQAAGLDLNSLNEQIEQKLTDSNWSDKDYLLEMQAKILLTAGNYGEAENLGTDLITTAQDNEDVVHGKVIKLLAQAMDTNGKTAVENEQSSNALFNLMLTGDFAKIDEMDPHSNLPTNYRLYNSYPNPFNPSTTIKFDLPVNSLVKLAVYDVAGRQVAVLANGLLNGGSHNMEFNGARLASGVYFYQLEAEGKIIGRNKMMLLK